MARNPLLALRALGQSVWLDYIQRDLLVGGEVARMIAQDGLAGMTSNPAIFEKAIVEHHDYDGAIARLARKGASAAQIYETLTQEDVRHAAELLRPVYDATDGRDGFVSLEVSPHLAHDTEKTIAEAKRLWAALDQPNVMIKVPATRAGLPAIRDLIAGGVNVNATLLFGVERYREVWDAFADGLERRTAAGQRIERIASVASFFLSRIDTLVDRMLDTRKSTREADDPRELRGMAAIACARLAYQAYKEFIAGERWQTLVRHGAHTQRLLWASTSTKDPQYQDVKYVEALIGSETVTTLPLSTLEAYREHGRPAVRLESEIDAARELPRRLRALGVDLAQVAERLENEGVEKFIVPFDKLHTALDRRRRVP